MENVSCDLLGGKMKKFIAILTACVALCAGLALAGCNTGKSTASLNLLEDGKLTIATSPDYPPFENLEDGVIVGFEADLWAAIAEEMGVDVVEVSLQFDAIIPAIIAGGKADIGVSGFTVTPERAEEIDFSDSYYIDDQALCVMKGGSITSDNAADELNKAEVTIAVQTGTTGETYALENYPNATVKGFGNSNDCFAAMQAGQVTAVCTNKAVVDKMLADSYKDAEVVAQSATGEEYAIVISKDNPELTKAINKALATLRDNGTIDELTQKWFA